MITSVIKAILIGSIVGALAFFAPFIILGFLVVSLIMKMVFRHSFRHGHHPMNHLAYAEKVRSMSDEEFAGFKKQFAASRAEYCVTRNKNNQN